MFSAREHYLDKVVSPNGPLILYADFFAAMAKGPRKIARLPLHEREISVVEHVLAKDVLYH